MEITTELLDKYIDRSQRYIEEADNREDWSDYMYYVGQKKAFEELRQLIK